MPYFIPSDPTKGAILCYGSGKCSVDKPVFLDGYLADKAMANPDFTDVIEAPVKKTRKKRVSKK